MYECQFSMSRGNSPLRSQRKMWIAWNELEWRRMESKICGVVQGTM